ncbi:MAG: radical SAM protein [Nanoarchaeota archaeon]|nr:radical SAM protein [Nanoarchaeota archaeon]
MKINLLNQKFSFKEIWKLRRVLLTVLLSPKKLINFIIINASLKLKLTKPLGLPFLLMIEPTSICNLNCPMCPMSLRKTNRGEKGHMNFKIFRKVIDEVGDYIIAVPLWNYGEPLLNPDLPKMIAYAKKKRIITLVSTNGVFLEEPLIRQLINSGLDYLILSFDGATKKTYEKYMGKGANYEKVISNLKNLVRIKKEMGKSNPFVNLQFIVMKENEHEIPLIKKLSKSLGVDKLSLKKFAFFGGNLDSFLPKEDKYLVTKHKDKSLIKTCDRVWTNSVISWDGTVVPCCVDHEFQYKLGNISTENFQKIWKNQKYISLRKQILKDINKIKMCQTCTNNDFTNDVFIEA